MLPVFENNTKNEAIDTAIDSALYEDKGLSYFIRRIIVERNLPHSLIKDYFDDMEIYQMQSENEHSVKCMWYEDGEWEFRLTMSLSPRINCDWISCFCRVYSDISWGETKEQIETRYEETMESVQSYLESYLPNCFDFEVTPIGFKVCLMPSCFLHKEYLRLLCGLLTLLIPFLSGENDLYKNEPKLMSIINNELVALAKIDS